MMRFTEMPIKLEKEPFPHFEFRPETEDEKLEEWLYFLKHCAFWNRVNETFYDQYEFSLLHEDLPVSIEALASIETLNALKTFAERLFDRSLSEKIDVVAHKLVKGDAIKIHNDFIQGAESHRILLHLNQDWSPDNGGYFMIFNSPNPEDVAKVIPPENGLVHGFEISEKSHHAVSEVHEGERFTVIYSLYSAT